MRRAGRFLRLSCLGLPLGFLAITLILPLLSGVILSFQADGFSLENYRFVLGDSLFRRSVYNTLILAAASLVVEFVWGLIFALLLSSRRRASFVTEVSVLMPLLIPEIVFLSVARYILLPRGYLNGALAAVGLPAVGWLDPRSALCLLSVALVDAWRVTPMVTLLLLDGLQGIPAELYEAALLDGAGSFAQSRYVTLPLLKPALYGALVLRGVDALRIFSTVLVLAGPEGAPVMSTYAYQLWGDAMEEHRAMAASVLLATMIGTLGAVVIAFRARTRASGGGALEGLSG